MKLLICMVVATLLCLLSGCAMMKDSVKYSGNCGGEGDGSNLTWILTGSGTLTISGTGKMTDGELPWNTFQGKLHEKVKRIIFEDGITYIGHGAFYSCGKIAGEVIIPDSVTVVGPSAFYECSGIERVKLPAHLERIEDYAFRGCSGWKGDCDLPESLTYIGQEAFGNCERLTGELHFSENLAQIGRCAFIRCSGLTGDLLLPDSLEFLGDYAFSQCESLNGRLKLSGKLTAIEMNTFSSTGLTGDLVIPDNVTEIGESAFSGCKNLNGTLTIGNGVREIKRYAFYYTSFENIIFGNAVEFIGSEAFSDNKELSGQLRFSGTLKYIGNNAFKNCPNISGVKLPDGSDRTEGTDRTDDSDRVDGTDGTDDSDRAGGMDGTDRAAGIEVIADGAFAGIKEAGGTVELPASVWYIGKNRSAFKDSCFTNIVYPGEWESDKEYKLIFGGKQDVPDGAPEAEDGQFSDGDSMATDSGDEPYVWMPEGNDLIGCGRFADTWLNFEQGTLQVCRNYRGEDVILAKLPVEQIDSDTYYFRTKEPFEYKGMIFQDFKFARWEYSAEVCMAYVKGAAGNDQILLFGDWTDSSDGMWNAYQHVDELTAAYKEE